MIRREEEYLKVHPEEAKLHKLDYALIKAEDEMEMLRNMDASERELQEKKDEVKYLSHEYNKQFELVHGKR